MRNRYYDEMEVKGGRMGNLKKDKRGISAVVATVLIILITVAAVTIIWAAVIPLVSKQIDRGTVCLDAVSQLRVVEEGYTCYKKVQCSGGGNCVEASLQVERGPKDFKLADLGVVVSIGGASISGPLNISDDKLPKPNERKVYTGYQFIENGYDTIQIVPIVKIGNSEVTCDPSPPVSFGTCS
jgi:cytochrome c biogenesis factor